MYPEDVDRQSRCRLPLPKREELSGAAAQIYDSLADPKGGSIRGLRGPGGIHLHSPQLALHARALNHYLRREAGLGGRLRELVERRKASCAPAHATLRAGKQDPCERVRIRSC